jgi:hypothetical protein
LPNSIGNGRFNINSKYRDLLSRAKLTADANLANDPMAVHAALNRLHGAMAMIRSGVSRGADGDEGSKSDSSSKNQIFHV